MRQCSHFSLDVVHTYTSSQQCLTNYTYKILRVTKSHSLASDIYFRVIGHPHLVSSTDEEYVQQLKGTLPLVDGRWSMENRLQSLCFSHNSHEASYITSLRTKECICLLYASWVSWQYNNIWMITMLVMMEWWLTIKKCVLLSLNECVSKEHIHAFQRDNRNFLRFSHIQVIVIPRWTNSFCAFDQPTRVWCSNTARNHQDLNSWRFVWLTDRKAEFNSMFAFMRTIQGTLSVLMTIDLVYLLIPNQPFSLSQTTANYNAVSDVQTETHNHTDVWTDWRSLTV